MYVCGSLSPTAGLRRSYRRAGHPERRLVQRQHADHAATKGQPDRKSSTASSFFFSGSSLVNSSPAGGGEWDCSSAEAGDSDDQEDDDGADGDSEDDHDDDKEDVDDGDGDFQVLLVSSKYSYSEM